MLTSAISTVLRTVLIEVEGILNSKPLGYALTDVADVDRVTPYLVFMVRLDSSLPQAVYAHTEILSCCHWRHTQALVHQVWTHFIRPMPSGTRTLNSCNLGPLSWW